MDMPTLEDCAARAQIEEYWYQKHTSKGLVSSYKCQVRFSLDDYEETKTLTAKEQSDLKSKVETQRTKFGKVIAKKHANDLGAFYSYQIKKWEDLLLHTIDIDDALDWTAMCVGEDFPKKSPSKPSRKKIPAKPKRNSFFKPISFFQKILGQTLRIRDRQQRSFDKACSFWRETKQIEDDWYSHKLKAFQTSLKGWERDKKDHENNQKEINASVADLRLQYFSGKKSAVEEYVSIVLSNSNYPVSYSPESSIQYRHETKILVIDFQLPSLKEMPNFADVKYTISTGSVTTKNMTDTRRSKLHESAMYQVAIRTVHEVFESDVEKHIQLVVFNGYLNSLDRATGSEKNNCIMSLSADRQAFERINLSHIDPKECFKGLKGISAPKLSTLTPVKPIATVETNDRRFVDSREITKKLDDSVNLAAMDWEDFEHLVRELFELEFGAGGTEVRVTQASSDGGVDAIAIDPDPIRGGKIVIQAKRYTNVVGVSAVRDLWGTVQHEGAMKGILVTTSDYGPDSYEFVKDKPLSLLNGSNLLHLLKQHGHRASIDMAAAKAARLD